jgi:hypothetical protein
MSYFRDRILFDSNHSSRLGAFAVLIETEGQAPMPEWVHAFLTEHFGGSRFASYYEGNTPMITARDLAEVMGVPVEKVVPTLKAALYAARNPEGDTAREATVERMSKL